METGRDDTEHERPDYILDLSSQSAPPPMGANGAQGPSESETQTPRPFLGVLFKCCGIYAKIYKTVDGKAYAGHCPKCAKPAHVKIGSGGTKSRFFTAE